MKFVNIPIGQLSPNTGQIKGLPKNPRSWTRSDMDKLVMSIRETPELLEARGLIVLPFNGAYVVLCGNMRLEAGKEIGYDEMPCFILPEETPIDKLREIVIKDNGSFGSWDWDMLANEWDDLALSDWGVPVWDVSNIHTDTEDEETPDEAEIERREREFRERMAAGEISEEDEEYQEFLEKFKLKKTTDDCYTPEIVYDAVAGWVEQRYGVSRRNFVRPFYPGGDYQAQKYGPDDIVVDNPPFSILAEILRFYTKNKIRFFLFCPNLTQFSNASNDICSLCIGVGITYENGAQVSTSFQTNMEDPTIRLKSEPSLYRVVHEANDKNLSQIRRSFPKYSYDKHVITAFPVCVLSKYGIEFAVPVAESESISKLDSQREAKKAIYGKGYLVSDRVVAEREKAEREKAEREKAEREKAEREKAERWELSERELAIVAKLNRQGEESRR